MRETPDYLDAILRRVAVGDREAFADFFDATYQTVDSWITGPLLIDHHDAVLIAAYLRVWIAAPSFPLGSLDLLQWLANVTAPALSRPAAGTPFTPQTDPRPEAA